MDPRVMELRIRQWIPVLEEQARSGLTKDEWCIINRVSRGSFFRWQRRVRSYLLEHGEDIGQLQDSDVNEQTDNESFVELPRSQAVVPGALVPGTMNEKCLAYEQNMNMNQRHDSKTCWCQASMCGGSPHSEMVQILLKGYI